MIQAVSSRIFATEARVRARVSPYRICGVQNVIRQVSFRGLRISPVSIIPLWLFIFIYNVGMNNRAVGGRR
jgi:hypothetical protein